jgi:hypothetical protein
MIPITNYLLRYIPYDVRHFLRVFHLCLRRLRICRLLRWLCRGLCRGLRGLLGLGRGGGRLTCLQKVAGCNLSI